MKKGKALIVAGAVMLAGVFGVALAQPTFADVKCPPGSANEGQSGIKTLAECNLTHHENDLMSTVNTIIDVIVGVIGVLAVVVIILGAIQYVMSSGDAAKLKKAKDTILYGVIGLVIAILAFSIVNFVLSSVFGGSSSGKSDKKTDESSVEEKTGEDEE